MHASKTTLCTILYSKSLHQHSMCKYTGCQYVNLLSVSHVFTSPIHLYYYKWSLLNRFQTGQESSLANLANNRS